MTNANDDGMKHYGNVISLPKAEPTAREPGKIDLKAYATDLAAALGWHVVPRDADWGDGAQVISPVKLESDAPNGRALVPQLVINQDWRKGKRILITGCWPHGPSGVVAPSGPGDRCNATFAPDRDVAAVAKEIGKRLLPLYLAAHAKCVERVQSEVSYIDQGLAIARRLAAGCDVRLREMGSARVDRRFSVMPDEHAAWASVEVNGEKVRIECSSLTEAQAAAILAIVKGG